MGTCLTSCCLETALYTLQYYFIFTIQTLCWTWSIVPCTCMSIIRPLGTEPIPILRSLIVIVLIDFLLLFYFDISGDNWDWICDLPNIGFVSQALPQYEGHANIIFQQEGNVLSWWKMAIFCSTYQVPSFQINRWMVWAQLISWSTSSPLVLFLFWGGGGGGGGPNKKKMEQWTTTKSR
jgi:hypothetical protein